jgi:hypothetical protein
MDSISYRVSKEKEYEDSIFYRISCSCMSDDHSIFIEFEHENGNIFLNFYKRLLWKDYEYSSNWLHNIWNRIKCAVKILCIGYIEVEESFILTGKEHIESFINALEEGKKKLEEIKED